MAGNFSLQGKTAVVFGGTSGIGLAIAKNFVKAGATVIPVSRDEKKVKKTVSLLQKDKNKWETILRCDVTKKEDIEQVCDFVVKKKKKIDIMVCSAGTHLKKESLAISEQEWRNVMNINLTGSFLTNQVVGKHMIKQKKGTIINIASLGSYVALSDALPYCVSKAGVLMLTKSLGVEWAPLNVRVNAIVPGVFPTPLNKKALSDSVRLKNIIRRTPMKRLGKLKELVGVALFLASDSSEFVTGADFVVDGGFLASSGF